MRDRSTSIPRPGASAAHGEIALVLAVDYPPEPGGIQRYTQAVCTHLRRLRPLVLAPSSAGAGDFDRSQSVATWRIPSPFRRRSGVVLPMAPAALVAALTERPCVVLCSHLVTTPIAIALERVLGIPFVLFVHGMELRTSRTRSLARAALQRAALVVANSRFTAAEAAQHGASPDRLCTTALGVPADWIDGDRDLVPQQASLRQRLRLDGSRVILSVSRLVDRYKGHDVILQALPLIAARVPDVRYVIAGDGQRRPVLEQLAERLGVADRVAFAGRLADGDLQALYGLADVFALANQEMLAGGGAEGFGIVFVEAAACGLPVVAGRSGGVADAVEDNRTGLLVDPADLGGVAEAIVRVLTDRALAVRLGRAGRDRVAAELTWPAIVDRIETRILQSCLVGSDRAHPAV